MNDNTATKQAATGRNDKGHFIAGNLPKTGFHTHPERRNDGRWNKEDSITYQYNLLMRMTLDELASYIPKTVAQNIALARIQQSMTDDRLGLMNTIEITDRTEGKAKQDFGLSVEERADPIIRGFVIPTLPSDFIDDKGYSNNVN